jgi:hypothetical protein
MYKTAVRWQIRRTIERLNAGEYGRAVAMFTDNATLAFPGDNTWANQHRPTVKGRDRFATHRGRDEIEAFLRRYVEFGFHMEVEDILVNGWPWRSRAAVRVRHWASGPTGEDTYTNRAVLFVDTTWGKIRAQEDYEDTERVAQLDQLVALADPTTAPPC